MEEYGIFTPRIDDTIQHFKFEEATLGESLMVLTPIHARIPLPMDCDAHPTCDCYSQCHAIIW